ncbi:MAG: hypothetical protein IJZ88_01810 [Clostridia bacterium]|nr:hypothetical protein [Clostridia bacterium]
MKAFYHSAYTNNGFKHIRLNSYNPDSFRYILKGNSGKVKENLFSKITDVLNKKNIDFCLSRNYDGRVCGLKSEDESFIICDGTHPFSDDAATFGAVDGIISLENFQQSSVLRKKSEDIVSLTQSVSEQERRCQRFLNAAAGINKDKKRLEKEIADSRKISRYSAKLWSTYGCPPSGTVGVEKKYFLSVPVSNGIKFDCTDIKDICDTAILIEGSAGYCSEMIIDRVRRYALSSGADVVSFKSFLDFDGVPEHIVIPALRFGVFTQQKEMTLAGLNVKKVRAKRFILSEMGESAKVRLQFNQRAYQSLIKEASESIKYIDKYNRELDDIYVESTDENSLCDYVMSKIFYKS